jgi:phosphomevalonate decarboxylase
MKATVVAHPIQGLIKYHGLKNVKLRLPFHDSISVCIEALNTTTTVETDKSLRKDSVIINGKQTLGKDFERVHIVLSKLGLPSHYLGHFRVVSHNSIKSGKGLGFSASAFAALGTAACHALDCDVDYKTLSEIVRLGAGSATRSLAGSFAIWYADKSGASYAEQIAKSEDVDLGMVVVPLPSMVKTDEAHTEVLSSPLFKARLKYVPRLVKTMMQAVKENDVATIGRLAEEDTLNLHASTMAGKAHMILWEPETVRIVKEVQKMRDEGIPAWFSMDTGPSVFVNTYVDCVEKVARRLHELDCVHVVTSRIGDEPSLSAGHLF